MCIGQLLKIKITRQIHPQMPKNSCKISKTFACKNGSFFFEQQAKTINGVVLQIVTLV